MREWFEDGSTSSPQEIIMGKKKGGGEMNFENLTSPHLQGYIPSTVETF